MTDLALIKDGAVAAIARNTEDAAVFGPEPDGEVVSFAPGEAVAGMLWDGQALTLPDADAGPAPRRLIAKSLVVERVNALGKLGVAFGALFSDPILFGRWFAPDWPRVYADDVALLALLDGIGCTAEEIETITAP